MMLGVVVVIVVALLVAAPLARGQTTTTLFPEVIGTIAECQFKVTENESWRRRDTGKKFLLHDATGTQCRVFEAGAAFPSTAPCPTSNTITAKFEWYWTAGENIQNVN